MGCFFKSPILWVVPTCLPLALLSPGKCRDLEGNGETGREGCTVGTVHIAQQATELLSHKTRISLHIIQLRVEVTAAQVDSDTRITL